MSRSWSDLDEGEHELYGREREEKIPIRLFFVQREKWPEHEALHVFWLFAYKNYPRYKSNRLLPFYYQLSSKIDDRYQFISLPYYRHIDGSERDQALFWLFYWGSDPAHSKSYHGLVPFYYHSVRGGSSRFLISPLGWYSHETYSGDGKADVLSSSRSIGFPIIPLVIWNTSPQKWDLIFLYLVRHRSRSKDLLTFALPLYYLSNSETNHSSFFLSPVYAHDSDDISSWRSILWLFYWGGSNNPEASGHGFSGLIPLYFYSRYGDRTHMMLTPLVWIKSTPERRSLFIFPLFYSADMDKESTKISPLYISLGDERKQFRLFFPLYMNYETEDYSFHLNATGISLSEEKLPFMPVSGEVSTEKVVADWDLGWFYNLFRLSSRDTIRFAAKPADPEAVAPPPAEKPRLAEKRQRTRADSENFLGLYFLFGVSAYERADHYRHFRLLPLSWLTWNTANNQGVQTVIPFYVHYRDEDTRYLVFYPVYGVQQKFLQSCTGEKSAWFIIAYWNEFDCVSQTSEQTILWPVYNHYKSPERGGFRIFPLFWKKWHTENGREQQKHFSPFHYTTTDGENYSTISWIFYKSQDDYDNTFGVWGLFHIMRSHDKLDKTTYFLPIYLSQTEYEVAKPAPAATENPPGRRRDTLFTFAALLWFYRTIEPNGDYFSMQVSPLHLSFREKDRGYFYSWLLYTTSTPSAETVGVPLLFHRRSYRDASYSNLYLLLYYGSHEKISGGGEENIHLFFPLYSARTSPASVRRFILWYYYESRMNYRYDLFPLVFGRTDDSASDSYAWHFALHNLWYKRSATATNFRLTYGLLGWYTDDPQEFSWHFALAMGYKRYKERDALHHRLLPLWWYSRDDRDSTIYLPFLLSMFENRDEGNRIFRAVLLGILYYQNTDLTAYDQTLGVLLGSLYYHNKYPERKFDSYGTLYGLLWHYETEENYKRFSILTFIYSRTEKDQVVRHKIFGIPL